MYFIFLSKEKELCCWKGFRNNWNWQYAQSLYGSFFGLTFWKKQKKKNRKKKTVLFHFLNIIIKHKIEPINPHWFLLYLSKSKIKHKKSCLIGNDTKNDGSREKRIGYSGWKKTAWTQKPLLNILTMAVLEPDPV